MISQMARDERKDDFLETEDPEGYAREKKRKKENGKYRKEQKKQAREEREMSKATHKGIVEQLVKINPREF